MTKILGLIFLIALFFIEITIADNYLCQGHKVSSSKSNFATKTGYFSAIKDDSLVKQLDEEGKNNVDSSLAIIYLLFLIVGGI